MSDALSQPQRILRVAIGALLALASLTAFDLNSSVSARCTGVGAPGQITSPNPSNPVGVYSTERALSATCDNLKDYNGQFRDTLADGGDAYVLYNKNGTWLPTASNPSLSNWASYSFTDFDGDAKLRLCDTNTGCHFFDYANNGF